MSNRVHKRIERTRPKRKEDILDFRRGILSELSLSELWEEELNAEKKKNGCRSIHRRGLAVLAGICYHPLMEKEIHDKIAKVINALDARLALVEKKAPKVPAVPVGADPVAEAKPDETCSDKTCFWCRTVGDCGK